MGGARARSRLRRERATARLRRAARCSDFARTAACAAMLSFCTNLSTPPIFLPPAAAFRQHFVVYKEIESRGARRRRAERSEVLHEGRALAYPSCSIRFTFVTLGLFPIWAAHARVPACGGNAPQRGFAALPTVRTSPEQRRAPPCVHSALTCQPHLYFSPQPRRFANISWFTKKLKAAARADEEPSGARFFTRGALWRTRHVRFGSLL